MRRLCSRGSCFVANPITRKVSTSANVLFPHERPANLLSWSLRALSPSAVYSVDDSMAASSRLLALRRPVVFVAFAGGVLEVDASIESRRVLCKADNSNTREQHDIVLQTCSCPTDTASTTSQHGRKPESLLAHRCCTFLNLEYPRATQL